MYLIKKLIIILCTFIVVSCASSNDIALLRNEVYYLSVRIDSLKSSIAQSGSSLGSNFKELTNESRKAKADIIYEITRIFEQNQFLKNQLDEVSLHKSVSYLTNMYQDENDNENESSHGEPGPEKLYNLAMIDLNRGNFPLAFHEFKKCVYKYPTSSFAPDAQYRLGDIYYQNGEYDLALVEFSRQLVDYPCNKKSAASLLKMSMCFKNKNDAVNSRKYIELIIQNFPLSEEAKIALSFRNNE